MAEGIGWVRLPACRGNTAGVGSVGWAAHRPPSGDQGLGGRRAILHPQPVTCGNGSSDCSCCLSARLSLTPPPLQAWQLLPTCAQQRGVVDASAGAVASQAYPASVVDPHRAVVCRERVVQDIRCRKARTPGTNRTKTPRINPPRAGSGGAAKNCPRLPAGVQAPCHRPRGGIHMWHRM